VKDQLERYEVETRHAYQDKARADAYDVQHMRGWSWARVTMHREVGLVRAALARYGVARGAKVLDVPCGTGVAAPSFTEGASVVASDISAEMMSFARGRYAARAFAGFVQGDITAMPFRDGTFDASVVLGFMHRVPAEVKEASARELARITSRVLIASFSVDSAAQRWKRRIIGLLKPRHAFSPAPWSRRHIERLLTDAGFEVRSWSSVVPVLSAEVIVVAERGAGITGKGASRVA
jgi:SAM-dependent methyltransferase